MSDKNSSHNPHTSHTSHSPNASQSPRGSQFFSDSIFWIDVEKIKPNPFQPRREFDDARLRDLAESIRMYGVLQPLVVTRQEVIKESGDGSVEGLVAEYELISGERRLRASKLAGLSQVPALIRSGEEDARVKLELAIIENLQREDLNAVDRARAFDRLLREFGFKHSQIAEKVGKSREYVSNTLRILALPAEILNAVSEGKVTDGHTRPLLMLTSRPEEQMTLFKEIMFKKLTVREAEVVARKIAVDKVRKKERAFDPELIALEEKFKESLGTRVHIERRDTGGKLTIDFFSADDLRDILERVTASGVELGVAQDKMENHIHKTEHTTQSPIAETIVAEAIAVGNALENAVENAATVDGTVTVGNATTIDIAAAPLDDRTADEIKKDENREIPGGESEGLYSVKNFTV